MYTPKVRIFKKHKKNNSFSKDEPVSFKKVVKVFRNLRNLRHLAPGECKYVRFLLFLSTKKQGNMRFLPFVSTNYLLTGVEKIGHLP
jgi:hypothetical protein